MALKRPQNILNQPPQPSFMVPGKEVFCQAWNLLAFSFLFAILFNTFFSDGIELKVKPPKSSDLSAMIKSSSSQDSGYVGWKKQPTRTPRLKPTSIRPVPGNITRLSLPGTTRPFHCNTCIFLHVP